MSTTKPTPDQIRAKHFGNVVEGPAGQRMPEAVARAVEAALKTAPRGAQFRRIAAKAEDFTLDGGTRTDVSYITTDAVDRDREVVLPSGIDTRQYNGVVTFAHQYDALPVGRCQWIKAQGNGLIAKTAYAPKPNGWDGAWMPDAVLSLMQMDPPTCTGKSIGFIAMGYRGPTGDEIKARPELAQPGLAIIDRAVLLEYAVAPVPCNPEAEMITVSKGFPAELYDLYGSAMADISQYWRGLMAGDESQKSTPPATPPVKLSQYVRPETVAKAVADRVEQHRKQIADRLGKQMSERIIDRIHEALGTP